MQNQQSCVRRAHGIRWPGNCPCTGGLALGIPWRILCSQWRSLRALEFTSISGDFAFPERSVGFLNVIAWVQSYNRRDHQGNRVSLPEIYSPAPAHPDIYTGEQTMTDRQTKRAPLQARTDKCFGSKPNRQILKCRCLSPSPPRSAKSAEKDCP